MPRILVIDDNPAVATALETLFSLHDIDTRSVTRIVGMVQAYRKKGAAPHPARPPKARGRP